MDLPLEFTFECELADPLFIPGVLSGGVLEMNEAVMAAVLEITAEGVAYEVYRAA